VQEKISQSQMIPNHVDNKLLTFRISKIALKLMPTSKDKTGPHAACQQNQKTLEKRRESIRIVVITNSDVDSST